MSLSIAFRVILMEFYENYKGYSGKIEIIRVEVEQWWICKDNYWGLPFYFPGRHH
jgi:hypothetical protein